MSASNTLTYETRLFLKHAINTVRRDRLSILGDGLLHGNTTTYKRGCRCDDCCEASTRERRMRRQRSAGTVPHNRDKTHCVHGHEYSSENTLIRPDGSRSCRACNRIRNRGYARAC